jgi:hypothetical protein
VHTCVLAHAYTCTRLRHAAAQAPRLPACLQHASQRLRHAGDACDFAPLERLHCDLVVMLWRQVCSLWPHFSMAILCPSCPTYRCPSKRSRRKRSRSK